MSDAIERGHAKAKSMGWVLTAFLFAVIATLVATTLQRFGSLAALGNTTVALDLIAGALGLVLLVPLVHVAVASTREAHRNSTSRRNIFFGWSVGFTVLSALVLAGAVLHPTVAPGKPIGSRTLGGLTLGQKVAFPQCARKAELDYANERSWVYSTPDVRPCWNFLGKESTPHAGGVPNGALDVHLKLPTHLKENAGIFVINGKIEDILLTSREPLAAPILSKLKDKWGEPTSVAPDGSARWEFEGFSLDLHYASYDSAWKIAMQSDAEKAFSAREDAERKAADAF